MGVFHDIFLKGVEWSFLLEILWRSIIMFILVLLVLRLSGKRGVRQLTLFEVAIILSLGSAAGDPMFQADVPVLYGALVLFSVIILYKLIAWASAQFEWFHKLMEGSPLIIIQNGRYVLNSRGNLCFSKREFFAELRNQCVEHLGQVRVGVLEVDGTLSLLFYEREAVQAGLPLFPEQYKQVEVVDKQRFYACMYCGYTGKLDTATQSCSRCERKQWSLALATPRIA